MARMLETQEEERLSVARDFHDKASQSMTLLCLLLAQAKQSASDKGKADLDEAQHLVMELAAELRALWTGLRPSMLDDIGLAAALQWYAQDFAERTHIRVDLHQRGLGRELPASIRTAAYRIVQEALTNVAKHAATKHADVLAECHGDILRLRVSDDGVGFDPLDIPLHCTGLRIVRERIRHLNGTISLESSPGKGSRLLVELPLGRPSPKHRG